MSLKLTETSMESANEGSPVVKRFLIIEDHPLFSSALAHQVTGMFFDAEIVECPNIDEARLRLQNERFDLALLDLQLEDRSGLEIISDLRFASDPPPVLIVSSHVQPDFVRRCLSRGASGYVTKSSSRKELEDAIIAVLNRRQFISADLAKSIAIKSMQPSKGPAHEALSPREFEILLQLSRGIPIKEVAHNLNISFRTVGVHKFKIMHKLGLRNAVDLVSYCQRHGLIAREEVLLEGAGQV
jgi:two-component system invasion response regulator UvrY